MVHVVAIAGSPAHPSRTYSLLEYATPLLQQAGVTSSIIAVRDLPLEDLIYGRYNSPALEPFKQQIAEASGIIVATPIYKAAYTGVLKTFLDLLPQKALADKVVLPIATGGTIAHLLALDYALKPVLSELGARHILGGVYAVDKQIQTAADGLIQLEPEIDERLQHAIAELTKAIGSAPVYPALATVH